MKRIIASVLSLAILFALGACGAPAQNNTDTDETTQPPAENEITVSDDVPNIEGDVLEVVPSEPEKAPEKEEETPAVNTPAQKPEKAPEQKPEQKPATVPEQKPVQTPAEKPEEKPVEIPEEKPAENQQSSATIAQTLAKDFKSKASAGASAESIANGLLSNSVIKFSGGVVPVEPGLLTGFDNAEITGFSEGAMFAPMIGTIPFVGYVFTLEDGTDASAFVAELKKNANPRWNICTEAEETVAESVGNKVFFVMSPKEMTE